MRIVKGGVTSGRFFIPYRVYGDMPDTIVCISGAKQTMAVWRSFVKHLVPTHSIVVFDLPGTGRAEILSGAPQVSFEEQQQVLLDVMAETARSKTVTLAAASWGTILAAYVAAKYPEKIEKMILGSFGVSTNDTILNLIQQGQNLYKQGEVARIAPLMIDTFGQYIPQSQKQQMVDQFANMDEQELLNFYEHCEFVKASRDISKLINLSHITAKTLVICGEQDAILDHDGIRAAVTKMPNCVYKLVPDTGHFLHWERPAILDTYSRFLHS
jgi:pimeloyl-ACP methyl ester carboxylesterase